MKLGMSVSLDEETHSKVRELMRKRRFRNKSHVVEEALQRMWEEEAGE